MAAEGDRLDRLAASVSDGSRVDWDAELERAVSGDARRQINHLRLVEEISSFHRSFERGSDPDEPRSRLPTLDPDELDRLFAPRAPLPSVWGRLEIKAKLGEGAYGEVFRAHDPNLQRDVALKLLKAEIAADDPRAAAVLDEGRMLARLRHPNVITVHGAEVHDGRVGLWMELVTGQTLSRLLEDQGRFGAREAALAGIDLCRALAAVHAAGLVHRDIKASNAMRDHDGRFLLMDFGAGQRRDEGQRARSLSGTPMYIAPEIFDGAPASTLSDVYAMGVLLYHLVSGAYPVEADGLDDLRRRHAAGESILLRDRRSELPESFVAVVERALERDPAARFATAGEFERALAASLGYEAKVGSAPEPSRVVRWVTMLAGAALVLAALAVVWSLFGAPTPTPSDRSGAVASASYSVQASLIRQRGDAHTRLVAGDAVAVGDELQLELRGSRELHVYVFNEDERGHAFALFPLPGHALQNPLAADTLHRLPGTRDGRPLRWRVTTSGGREHLIVLASPEPLEDYEAELARLELPSVDATALEVPAGVQRRLRGIGGLSVGTDAPAASTRSLHEMARTLSGQSETVTGIWMREIELLNPPE